MNSSAAPRPLWRRLVGPLVSILAVAALLWVVDVRATWDALLRVQPAWLLLASGCAFAAWVVQGVRWRWLLPDEPGIPVPRLIRTVLIGLFGNLVLPLRAGDVIRIVLINRALGGQLGRAVTSVALDRLIDLGAVLVLGALAGLFVDLPDGWTRAIQGLSLGLATLIALGAVLVLWPSAGQRVLARIPWVSLRERLTSVFVQAHEGLSMVRRPGTALALVGWTSLQWLCTVGSVWCCLQAFDPGLGTAAAILFTVATNLGSALPSAPSAAGVYHTFGVLSLAPFGVAAEEGMAIALVSHGVFVLLQLLGGAGSVWWEGGTAVLRLGREEG